MTSTMRLRFLQRAPTVCSSAYTSRPLARRFSIIAVRQEDKKEAMLDRNKMNTESNEYSKSGSDAATAGEDEAAFDPDKTSPESEKKTAGKQSKTGTDPLNVSPGNQEVSEARDPEEGGAESGVDRTNASSRGGPSKGRKVS